MKGYGYMKKLLLLLSFLAFISTGFTQGIHVAVGGGMTFVQGPDQWTNPLDKLGADFNTEYNVGVKVKLGLPLIPIVPVAGMNYYFMKGNLSSSDYSKSLNLLSLYAGGEYALIPGPFSPYAGLDLQYNYFMEGKEDFPGGSASFSGSGSRVGLGIGAGIDFKLLPFLGLDLNLKYNIFNLLGKQSGEPTYSVLNLNLYFSF